VSPLTVKTGSKLHDFLQDQNGQSKFDHHDHPQNGHEKNVHCQNGQSKFDHDHL
jgi:hypothetical protein